MNWPVIALVGRPNVGKSTLFNYLTRARDALVADYPGLTRDRQYGPLRRGERPAWIIDTGGWVDDAQGIDAMTKQQTRLAMDEADVVVFLVDGREGPTATDEVLAEALRKLNKPLILAINKTDGMAAQAAELHEFHRLGLGEPQRIAAAHGHGIADLLDDVMACLPAVAAPDETAPQSDAGITIAVIGRPNVGKSTLVNRLLGEERVIVFDEPGTTRDSIYIPFERNGERYTLIDTAGVRRRARISEAIEKFSVIKSLQAIEHAHVVIYLIDAQEGVTDQDASLLGLVLETGRALLIGLNKWDGLTAEQKAAVKRLIDLKLSFLPFVEKYPISALHGSGVGHLLDRVKALYHMAMVDLPTPRLTELLQRALTTHQPPLVKGRRIKLKYAHQGGHNPPVIVIHGNQTEDIPKSYQRYLHNFFREQLQLDAIPLRLEFRSADNPFEGRKNALSERQIRKRRRLMKHVKKTKK